MLDTIREIGIFMIAAQAVVHFAPGRQYEKYIKAVSGIIILLLFLKPVLRLAGAVWEEPQALLKKWEEMTDMSDFSVQAQKDGVTEEVVKRMAAEIEERLNRELAEDACVVGRVSIRFTEEPGAEAGTLLPEVTVFLREQDGEETGGRIEIAEIVVGQQRETDTDEALLAYRTRFATLLGIEEERVEVRWDGRG